MLDFNRSHYPKLFNKYHCDVPKDAVYIGRGSKWGNPFVIGKDGNREEVIEKYTRWIYNQPQLINSLHELRGRNIFCYCFPKLCHGMVLIELIKDIFGDIDD